MSLGVCLKGLNAALNKQWLDFFSEFLPQITFLLCLFGAMDALIVAKWLTNWTGRESEAPSIISQMINNVLKGGELSGSPVLGEGQPELMTRMLWVCLFCVPVMLCVKPWYIHRQHKGRKRRLKRESGISKRRSDLVQETTSGSESDDLVRETPARLLRLPTKKPKHQLSEIVIH